MEKLRYEKLNETVYFTRLQNGLPVYVIQKSEYAKSYAFFAANYGSVDTGFTSGGGQRNTPDGVAHFLEHKLFDMPDGGNALQELSKNGASVNAFTSSSMTAYFFECAEKFDENLRILLDFVKTPYFTPESVEKEQGIIGQEIRMIEDNPSWRLYNNMLGALYESHPVRISVAGSVESIAEITADTLCECHGAFYTPSNMVLCAAGNIDPESVCAVASEVLSAESGEPITRDYGNEDERKACKSRTIEKMEVSAPLFMIGYKCKAPSRGREYLKNEIVAELACEALAGNSSPFYTRLYAEGLLNRNYEYGYNTFSGGACALVSGESRDPEAVAAQLTDEIARVCREGIDQELFDRLKKAAFGARMRVLNSFDGMCHQQAAAHFADSSFFDFADIFAGISAADAEAFISENFTPAASALSLISPRSEA